MKKLSFPFFVFALCLGQVHAQLGGGGAGQTFDRPTAKLFGGNSAFSGIIETHAAIGTLTTVMPGKVFALDGNTRTEMSLEDITGSPIPPAQISQMKAMGMNNVIVITRPDRQVAYLVYPDLKAYAENPIHDPSATNSLDSFKLESTEVGKEDVEGHPCVKHNAVVTDGLGAKHEYTVWNATDLKQFPVKIESTAGTQTTDIYYNNIKLSKPDASLFEPPAGFKKYGNIQSLMIEEASKRISGGAAVPGQ
jgi:hypothetical protein